MNIGDKILFLRKEKNLTQEQLGEILNISPAAVSKWETKNAYPDIELLPMIASIFNVSIDFLFNYEVTSKPNVEEVIRLSRELMDQKRSLEVIGLLKESLIRFSNNVDLIFELAKNQMLIARFSKSTEQLKLLKEAKEGFQKVIKMECDYHFKLWSYHYLTTIAINNNELDLAEYYNKNLILPKGINSSISEIAIKSRRNDSDIVDFILKSIEMDIYSYSYKFNWLINSLMKKEQYELLEEEVTKFINILLTYTSNRVGKFNLIISEFYESLAFINALNGEYEKSQKNLDIAVKYVSDYQRLNNDMDYKKRLLEVIQSNERKIYKELNQDELISILNKLM